MKINELTAQKKKKPLSPELIERNKLINFKKLVKEKADVWAAHHPDSSSSQLGEEDIDAIVEFFEKSKVFSLNRLMDSLRDDISIGFLQNVIDAAKEAINVKGFGRTGNSIKSQSRGERIDSYLKQKWIGPIKR